MSLTSKTKSIPWRVRVEGDDLVVSNARVTCFGGANDPQDNGETASGLSTKQFPWIAAASLPMDASKLKCSARVHAALDGSPLPLTPWGAVWVIIESINGQACERFTFQHIDRGPSLDTGNALDLTIAAARCFKPKATATNFELINVTFRIKGGARFL